jgi:hypothetical protein
MDAEFEATAEQYRFLASREFNAQDVRKYVKVLCDVENVADVDLPTRTQNTIDKIMNKIFGEKQSMPGVAGTWWAAYNGFNEYLNYEYGRNDNNRIDSLWFGTSATDNKKALTLALTMAG